MNNESAPEGAFVGISDNGENSAVGQSAQSSAHSAALAYAARGWSVFPARVTIVNGRKQVQPRVLWRDASTTDAGQIARWWGEGGEFPSDSVCIDTGKSGLVVVDLDGEEGKTAWKLTLAGAPVSAPGWIVRTPGGGEHWYYSANPLRAVGNDSTGKVATRVDVRGLGGFVIAPPSSDARGAYVSVSAVAAGAFPVVPELVAERLAARAPDMSVSAPATDALANAEFGLVPRTFTFAQAIAFCRPAMEALAAAPDGTINARLNDAGVVLSHFNDVPGFWSSAQAQAWLMEALGSTLYDGATWRAESTIASAFGTASARWRAVLETEVAGLDSGPFPGVVRNSEEVGEEDAVARLRAELLDAKALAERPNPVPLVVGVLDMDSEAWLIGAPGSFKSFVALDLAGHVGAGRAWQGLRTRQGGVIYLVGEGVSGFKLRVEAWASLYGSLDGVRFLPRPVQAKSAEWGVLVELCRQDGPALIVIDTQARHTVGINENDATEMGLFLEQVRRLREATGACVLVVHHIGRNGENARGSSAIDGAQGTELRVHRPKPKELHAEIHMDKQKDMADADVLRVDLASYDAGVDEETGRALTSLVVKPAPPFGKAPSVTQRWIEDLPENQSHIIAVLADHAGVIGMTYADCKAHVVERFGPVHRSSFSTAMNRLRVACDGREALVVQIKGTQRLALASLFSDGEQ